MVMCENSFSEHRPSMLCRRKAQLIQLAFEKDLTQNLMSKQEDTLMRRVSSEKHCLLLC